MLNLLALLLLSAPGTEPSVAAVVGVRVESHYWTAFLRLTPSQGYLAAVSRGLFVPSATGLMFVDVVSSCGREEPQQEDSLQQHLSIKRVTGRVHAAPCSPPAGAINRPKTVRVLFVGRKYISVFRYGESWNGRGFWRVDTRGWDTDSPIPMGQLLPAETIADVDRWAAEQREQGISRALSEGLTGDADPCWHPDPSHELWAITRSDRRWVVMALLQSSCTTDPVATPIAVPDSLVDGSRNRDPGIALPTSDTPGPDIVVSPEGRLAVLSGGSSVMLSALEGGTLGRTLAEVALPVTQNAAGPTLVMVQWLDRYALSHWLPMLTEAMAE
jgi:hypothetical protein